MTNKNGKEIQNIEGIMQTPNKVVQRDDLESDDHYFNPTRYFQNYVQAIEARKKEHQKADLISKADVSQRTMSMADMAKMDVSQRTMSMADMAKMDVSQRTMEPQTAQQKQESGPEASIKQMYPGAKIVKAPVDASNVGNVPSTKPKKAIAVVNIGGSRYYVYPGKGGGIKTSSKASHPEFLHSGMTGSGTPYHAYKVAPSDEEVQAEAETAAKENRKPKTLKDKVMYYNNKIYEDDGNNAITVKDGDREYQVSSRSNALEHFSDYLSPEGKQSLKMLSGKSSHIRQHRSTQEITRQLKGEYTKFMKGEENKFLEMAQKYSEHVFEEGTNKVNSSKFQDIHGSSLFGENWREVKSKLDRHAGIYSDEHLEEWKKNHKHLDEGQMASIDEFVKNKLNKIKTSKDNNIVKDAKGKTLFDFNKQHPLQVIKDIDDVSKILNSKTVRNAVSIAAGSFSKTNPDKEYNEIKQDMEEHLSSNPNWLINFDQNMGDFKSHLTNGLLFQAKSKHTGGALHFKRGNELEKIISSYLKENKMSSKELTFDGLLNYINSNDELKMAINRNGKNQKVKSAQTLLNISENFKDVIGQYNGPASLDAPVGDDAGASLGDISQASNVQYTTSSLEGYILNCMANEPKVEALSRKEQMFKDTGLNEDILKPADEFENIVKEEVETKINKDMLLDTLDGVLARAYQNMPSGMSASLSDFQSDQFDVFESSLKETSGNDEDISIENAVSAIDSLDIDKEVKEQFKNGISKKEVVAGLGGMSPEQKAEYKEKRKLAETISNVGNQVIDSLSNVSISGERSKDVKFEDSLGFILSHLWSPFMETFGNTGYKYTQDPGGLQNQDRVSPSDIIKNNVKVLGKKDKEHPIKKKLNSFKDSRKDQGYYFSPQEIMDGGNVELSEHDQAMLKDMIESELIPSSISKMLSKHFNTTAFGAFTRDKVRPAKYIAAKILNPLYDYMGIERVQKDSSQHVQHMEEKYGQIRAIQPIADDIVNQIRSSIQEYDNLLKIKKSEKLKFGRRARLLIKAMITSFEFLFGVLHREKIEEDPEVKKEEVIDQINTLKEGLKKKEAEIKMKRNPKVDQVLYPKTQRPVGSYPNKHSVEYNDPPPMEKGCRNLPITQRKKKLFEKSTLTKINLLPELGVSFIIGKIKNDPEKRVRVQSVLFNQDPSIGKAWDLPEAKNWVKNNKDKIKKAIKYSEFIERYQRINKYF